VPWLSTPVNPVSAADERTGALTGTHETGACMCKKFADDRYRALHNWGQPGCKHERK
jgi:hypothetical protein